MGRRTQIDANGIGPAGVVYTTWAGLVEMT
jgi:hypothetical protein